MHINDCRFIMTEICFSSSQAYLERVTPTKCTKWSHHVAPRASIHSESMTHTVWVANHFFFLCLSPHHSIIKTKGRAMEVVTHFVNDTVEFYKWSLTIAGKIFTVTCFTTVWEPCATSDAQLLKKTRLNNWVIAIFVLLMYQANCVHYE